MSVVCQHVAIMQVIWSRATQARSCRCSSCLHTATITARRSTTAASRRRLHLGDLFTACYSTILATAAIADSKVKDDKMREWDRVIAEAKVWTPDCVGSPNKRDENKEVGTDSLGRQLLTTGAMNFQVGNKEHNCISNSDAWKIPPQTRIDSFQAQLRNLDAQLKLLPSNRPPCDSSRTGFTDLELEALLDEGVRSKFTREPQKPIHLERMEEMVARLVRRLLDHMTSNIERKRLSLSARDTMNKISVLQMGTTQLPKFSRETHFGRDESVALNKSIWACFRNGGSKRSKRPSTDLLLSKICYNLLVSTTPPNIVTYNILIISLTKLKQHDIAQIIIDSFFNDSRFKPTSRTICAILDHYAAKRDTVGFRATIQRMRGVNGDMRMKKRAVYDLWDKSVQSWAASNRVIHRGAFLTEKALRTNEIFDSLIRGSLQLMGFKSAIRYIRAALREGCEVNPGTFGEVVMACLSQADFRAGLSLLSAIVSSGGDTHELSKAISYSAETRYYLHALLNFCGVSCFSTAKQTLSPDVPGEGLHILFRQLRLASLTDIINQIAHTISKLEAISVPLRTISLQAAYAERLGQESHSRPARSLTTDPQMTARLQSLEMALEVLSQVDSVRLRAESSMREAEQIAIESRLKLEERKLAEKEQSLLSMSYDLLPEAQRSKYDNTVNNAQKNGRSGRLPLLSTLHRERECTQDKAQGYEVGQAKTFEPPASASVITHNASRASLIEEHTGSGRVREYLQRHRNWEQQDTRLFGTDQTHILL